MTYPGSGDPARRRTDYYPPWLDSLADDVTLEGSVVNHRPRSSLLLFSRLMGEKFAGTPYGEQFASSQNRNTRRRPGRLAPGT